MICHCWELYSYDVAFNVDEHNRWQSDEHGARLNEREISFSQLQFVHQRIRESLGGADYSLAASCQLRLKTPQMFFQSEVVHRVPESPMHESIFGIDFFLNGRRKDPEDPLVEVSITSLILS
jgi:hypothetical protein